MKPPRNDSPLPLWGSTYRIARLDCTRIGSLLAVALLLAGCGGGSSEPSPSPPAPAADYTGTGTANIGPVDLPNGADAEWTSTGGLFMLIALEGPSDMANPQIIVSQASSGSGFVPPGNYSFKVSTWSSSEWTLSFDER